MKPNQNNNSKQIRLEIFPDDGADSALLKKTVALQVWADVLVSEEVSVGLSVFDQFTLECLLQLDSCCAEDLCEVIGIDPELAQWWLDGVVNSGLARMADKSMYLPNMGLCVKALESKTIQKQDDSIKTMIWFPETGEILVLNQQDKLLVTLSRIEPIAGYPLSDKLVGANRGDLVRNSQNKSLLYGNASSSISAVNDTSKIDDRMCPAYLLELDIAKADSTAAKVNIYGYPARRGSGRQTDKRDLIRKTIRIPRLYEYENLLRQKIGSLNQRLCHAMEEEGFLNPQILEEGCQAALDYDKAREMADQTLLDFSKRITFFIDDEMEYEIPFKLKPENDRVAALFKMDSAVRRLLANHVSNTVLGELCSEYNITRGDFMLRLWQVKQYAAIYKLREEQDFFE